MTAFHFATQPTLYHFVFTLTKQIECRKAIGPALIGQPWTGSRDIFTLLATINIRFFLTF